MLCCGPSDVCGVSGIELAAGFAMQCGTIANMAVAIDAHRRTLPAECCPYYVHTARGFVDKKVQLMSCRCVFGDCELATRLQLDWLTAVLRGWPQLHPRNRSS